MFNMSIPIDDYINKTFLIKEEDMIILPKKKNEERKCINISMSLKDNNNSLKNIDIICALSDGYINGYIECCKDITKNLLLLNYSYDDILNITGLSLDSINNIKNEL